MDSDRYIKKIERFHDKYVDLYNAEKSKLKAFSELSNIHTGLKEIRSLKKSRIKENSERMIELFLVGWVYETNDKELTFHECIELADDINSDNLERNIKELLDDVHGIKSIDQTRQKIVSELKKLFVYSDEGQIPLLIDSALKQLEELQKLIPNLHALVSLMEKIISLEYPETLNNFSQLSEKDQKKLLSEKDQKNHDKIKNRHAHRKQEIINKYHSLRSENPEETELRVRGMVQDWYSELTKKSIDEGTIRYYLEEK